MEFWRRAVQGTQRLLKGICGLSATELSTNSRIPGSFLTSSKKTRSHWSLMLGIDSKATAAEKSRSPIHRKRPLPSAEDSLVHSWWVLSVLVQSFPCQQALSTHAAVSDPFLVPWKRRETAKGIWRNLEREGKVSGRAESYGKPT